MSGTQTETIHYVVKKRFKYGDRVYEVGETWEPTGGQFDEQLIELQEHIRTVDDRINTRAQRIKASNERSKTDKIGAAAYAMRMLEPPKTFREIGEALGVSTSTARSAFKREEERMK